MKKKTIKPEVKKVTTVVVKKEVKKESAAPKIIKDELPKAKEIEVKSEAFAKKEQDAAMTESPTNQTARGHNSYA